MNRLVASLAVPVLLTACSTLPAEHQLVGTWTMPATQTSVDNGVTIKRSHSKEMVDLTLTADHRFIWTPRGRAPDATGRWHLDGHSLVWEFTSRRKGHKVTHPYRDRIIRLTPTELVYIQGEDTADTDVHLTRRSSEPLAAPRSSFR
jgi:hypothetical protein